MRAETNIVKLMEQTSEALSSVDRIHQGGPGSGKSVLSKVHKPYAEKSLHGSPQAIYRFENGFGASVVSHFGSYGLELAVIRFEGDDWSLTYDTPITEDVIGHLDSEMLEDLLNQIKALPA
jgi:hypothetical protein